MYNYQEGFLAARQLGEARGGEEVPEHRGDDQEEGASPADRGRQVQGGQEDLQRGFRTTQVLAQLEIHFNIFNIDSAKIISRGINLNLTD